MNTTSESSSYVAVMALYLERPEAICLLHRPLDKQSLLGKVVLA